MLFRSVSISNDDAYKYNDAALEALRIAIPAARGLPLLQAIAQQKNQRVILDYLDNTRLAVEVTAC